jgi:excisionase family DNA binding protein
VGSNVKKQPPSNVATINQTEPLLVDISGAARMLSSTPWTIRHLLWDKKIPFTKIGKKFLMRPSDIRAFVERQIAA